eukprot:TRINITY_DN55860_c0_g1_i1.p1 TRINITY_DN55860_c0_g1~~TRINITY_DN55860_c0_g1_i1.p1  ORF type:complete len:202 (+),score=34.87 TRINITY_DN55860_c0_g1_i1:91-696(+)
MCIRDRDNTLLFAWEVARTAQVKKRIQDPIDNGAVHSQHFPDLALSKMLFHMYALRPESYHNNKMNMERLTVYRTLVRGTAPGVKGVRVHSVDEVTPEGQTALHYAAARHKSNVSDAESLLKWNANPHIRDKFGQLPIDLASTTEMKELLQAAMDKSTAPDPKPKQPTCSESDPDVDSEPESDDDEDSVDYNDSDEFEDDV